jgi:hypothetical protein
LDQGKTVGTVHLVDGVIPNIGSYKMPASGIKMPERRYFDTGIGTFGAIDKA